MATPAGDLEGSGAVGLEDDHLLGSEDRVGSDDRPRLRGVLRRDEVRVGAVGSLGRRASASSVRARQARSAGRSLGPTAMNNELSISSR